MVPKLEGSYVHVTATAMCGASASATSSSASGRASTWIRWGTRPDPRVPGLPARAPEGRTNHRGSMLALAELAKLPALEPAKPEINGGS